MKTVDELGAIQAQIAALRLEEAELKAALLNGDELEGDLFKATIVRASRKVTNWKGIAVKLGASVQMIRGNTKVQDTVSVRVTARDTNVRKAA